MNNILKKVYNSIKNIVFYILLMLILILILSYIWLKWFIRNYNEYTSFTLLLKKASNEDNNFMNYGYWKDNTRTLDKASKNLCNYLLQQGGLKHSKKLLDVGCGYGDQDIYIYSKLSKDTKITAIDINENIINKAKKNIKKKKLQDKIDFNVGNACRLEYVDNKFDTVFCLESAFHYDTREDFLKEAYRVLEHKGKLVIADILINDDILDIYNYSFKKIFKNLFKIPDANLISMEQLHKQLEDIGFKVKIWDISPRVFKPFYKNMITNFKTENNIGWISSTILGDMYINKLCNGTNCFKYIVAICEKI